MILGRRALIGFAAFAAACALPRLSGARPTWKTLAGPFTQERTIGLLRSVVRSRGVLTLVRPDRLRWELLPPDEITYWVTPDALAYKSAKGAGRIPATQARVAASLEDLRALLLGDASALQRRYDVVETPRQGGLTLEATPKAGVKSAFQKLTLELAEDLLRPARATLLEGARDKTDIVFGDLKVDAPVDPKLMQPPA